MIFEKAYKELLQGKKIRRKEWEPLMHIRIVEDKVKTFKGEYTNFYSDASILISDDWKVIDGDGQYINFVDALEQIKNKKCITRKNWEENNLQKFIFLDKDQLAICKEIEFEFMPTYKCLCSQDWEIMK